MLCVASPIMRSGSVDSSLPDRGGKPQVAGACTTQLRISARPMPRPRAALTTPTAWMNTGSDAAVPVVDSQNPTCVAPIIAKNTNCPAIVLSFSDSDWVMIGSHSTCMYCSRRASNESAVARRIVNSAEGRSSIDVRHAASSGSKAGCNG